MSSIFEIMGLASILAVFDTARKEKKQEKEAKKHAAAQEDLAQRLTSAHDEYEEFLKSHGIRMRVCGDLQDVFDAGENAVRLRIIQWENERSSIEEFLQLGGKAYNIRDHRKINEYLTKLRYLIKNDRIDLQDSVLFQRDMSILKECVESEL